MQQDEEIENGWVLYPPLESAPDEPELAHSTYYFLQPDILSLAAIITLFGAFVVFATRPLFRDRRFGLLALCWALLVFPVFELTASLLAKWARPSDRNFGSAFFAPDGGGEPAPFQHFFWFIGHYEVWFELVRLICFLGVMAFLFRRLIRQQDWLKLGILSSSLLAVSVLTVLAFQGVYKSYLVGGANIALARWDVMTLGFVSLLGWAAVAFIIVQLALFAFRHRRFADGVPGIFALGVALCLILGLTSGWLAHPRSVDHVLHDTYFIVAHYRLVAWSLQSLAMLGVGFALAATVFHWRVPTITARVHAGLSVLAANLLVAPGYAVNTGMPERYVDYADINMRYWDIIPTAGNAAYFLAIVSFSLCVGLTAYNTLRHGRTRSDIEFN